MRNAIMFQRPCAQTQARNGYHKWSALAPLSSHVSTHPDTQRVDNRQQHFSSALVHSGTVITKPSFFQILAICTYICSRIAAVFAQNQWRIISGKDLY